VPQPAGAHPAGARPLRLPAEVRGAVADAAGVPVTGAAAVTGGCISPSFRVGLEDGRALFVKTLPPGGPAGLMEAEARALAAMGATATVRVPEVVAAAPGWLALEWLEPAAAGRGWWESLGRELARLHRGAPPGAPGGRGPAPSFGWDSDNFIGTLPQSNPATDSWPEFWVESRLRPQLRRAWELLDGGMREDFGTLFRRAGELLGAGDEDGPSLLHGDLWSGNVHMSQAGPALIDPSSSHGHREVDLAMARLFGGFPRAFFDAYQEQWPLLPGAAARRPLYQLFYLLVHVNLFGSGYLAMTREALRQGLG
jgi:protein-ribulosamine 3-kinase